jgi:hypothetical protein
MAIAGSMRCFPGGEATRVHAEVGGHFGGIQAQGDQAAQLRIFGHFAVSSDDVLQRLQTRLRTSKHVRLQTTGRHRQAAVEVDVIFAVAGAILAAVADFVLPLPCMAFLIRHQMLFVADRSPSPMQRAPQRVVAGRKA